LVFAYRGDVTVNGKAVPQNSVVLLDARGAARGVSLRASGEQGAAVMLFNWIVINFVISGLHSYA
jgi:redox-sensitive bicupin YhaK (pirin superfamily)